jgi:hypothetical protein
VQAYQELTGGWPAQTGRGLAPAACLGKMRTSDWVVWVDSDGSGLMAQPLGHSKSGVLLRDQQEDGGTARRQILWGRFVYRYVPGNPSDTLVDRPWPTGPWKMAPGHDLVVSVQLEP